MSEPIPESIPTSLSRASQRPLKRLRANDTPTTQQANQISNLMLNPDLPLPLPSSTLSVSNSENPSGQPYTPPEIVANVQGSSAGAGSGEFHVYKASRRREYARIQGMEEEAKKEEDDRVWEVKREEVRGREEREREKKRHKRGKRKERKGRGSGKDGEGIGKDAAAGEGGEEKIKSRGPGPGPLRGSGLRNEIGAEEEAEKGVEVVEENGIVIHDDD